MSVPTNSQPVFHFYIKNQISHNAYHNPFKTTYTIIADLAKIPLAFSGY